jgi:hypothetical protein
MKTIVRSYILKASAVVAGGCLMLFGFQNCGKAGFDQALDTTSMGTVDAKSASAPFAYNSTFDSIAYNSCAGRGANNKPGFFTFSAGSFAAGGINVRQDFLNYAKSNLKPVYPATAITVEQLKQFVAGTPESAEANLQMSLRVNGAPNQPITPSGAAPVAGYDYVNLLMDLTDDRMMEPVFRAMGGVANYFPLGISPATRVLSGNISYNADVGMAEGVRISLTGQSMLALTYTGLRASAGYAARTPASATTTNTAGVTSTDQSVAYGKGYKLTFSQDIAPFTRVISGVANPQPDLLNPRNILREVQEVDLENPAASSGPGWTCDEGLRFAIVRTQDGPAACPPDSFDRLADPGYRAVLEIARRHLRPDQWDISVDRRCVVPKSGSCYLDDSGVEKVPEYNQANGCYYHVDGIGRNTTNYCAEYVSICTRN